MLLGIDGLSPSVLRLMLSELKAPLSNLWEIIYNGCIMEVESVVPPSSAPAWTSIFTGLEPNEHNVYDFFDTYLLRKGFIKIESRLSSIELWKRCIWSFASKYGKKVLSVGVPIFYPAREVNGIYIAGELLVPKMDAKAVYPPYIYQEIRKLGYEESFSKLHGLVARVATASLLRGREQELISEFVANERKKFEIFRKFSTEEDFELLIFISTAYDHLAHYFLDEKNIKRTIKLFRPYIQLLDEVIKYVLSMMDENTILLLVSDHGMHSLEYLFLINNWLRKKGLLAVKNHHHLKPLRSYKMGLKMIRFAGAILHTIKLNVLASKFSKFIESRFRETQKANSPADTIDIDNSLAYCMSYTSFGLFLKDENIKKKILAELTNLKTPDGKPLFLKLLNRKGNKKAPDILFVPNRGVGISTIILKTDHYLVSNRDISPKKADHSNDALFGAYHYGRKNICHSSLFRIKKITEISKLIRYLLIRGL